MVSRVLAIPLLVLGLSTFSTRAIATIPAKAAISSVEQSSLKQDRNPSAGNPGVTDQILGALAICLLGTPVLGSVLYKQHLAYRKAIHHNNVKHLQKVWTLPSNIR